jgi:hypothetical protein
VVRRVAEAARRRLREDPAVCGIDVSQMDHGNHCQCPGCTALVQREGSPAALYLHLANGVAAALAEEFPRVAVHTLAYRRTRQPPRTLRAHPNVTVEVCAYESCRSHPLATCPTRQSRELVEDLRAWTERCAHVHVWDYTTDFRHYLLPFPNLRSIDDNLRLHARLGVEGVYLQDCYQQTGGELSPLGGYLQARLLWDPDRDADLVIDEFLQAVYAEAAGPLRRYVDLLHDWAATDQVHVSLQQEPVEGYPPASLLESADRLLGRAETLVAGHPEVLARVQLARTSVDYTILWQAHHRGALEAEPARAARNRLRRVAEAQGLRILDEQGNLLAEWLDGLE